MRAAAAVTGAAREAVGVAGARTEVGGAAPGSRGGVERVGAEEERGAAAGAVAEGEEGEGAWAGIAAARRGRR